MASAVKKVLIEWRYKGLYFIRLQNYAELLTISNELLEKHKFTEK